MMYFIKKENTLYLNIFSSSVHLKDLGKIVYPVSVIVFISQIEIPFPTKIKLAILEK